MTVSTSTRRALWLDPAYPDRSCRGADPNDFVQEDGERRESMVARMRPVAEFYCAGCPVRQACREVGRGERWGLWGGVVRLKGAGSSWVSGVEEIDLLA